MDQRLWEGRGDHGPRGQADIPCPPGDHQGLFPAYHHSHGGPVQMQGGADTGVLPGEAEVPVPEAVPGDPPGICHAGGGDDR